MLYNHSTLVLGWVYVSLWPQTSVWNLCFWLASWTTLWSTKIKKKSFFYYKKGSLLQNTTLFKLHISFNLTKHHNHQEKKKKHKTLKSFKSSLCVTNYFCDRNHNLMSLSRENKNTHMKPFQYSCHFAYCSLSIARNEKGWADTTMKRHSVGIFTRK